MNEDVTRQELTAIKRRLRWLQIYALALTALAVAAMDVAVLMGRNHRSGTFEVERLEVERIDVVEPGGTRRLIITSAAQSPNDHRGPMAGMLFFNSDGIENGGLVIDGAKRDGKVEHAVHLSMDRYDQDQTVVLRHLESGGTYFSGLLIQDRPATSIERLKERLAQINAMPEGAPREQAMAALKAEAKAEAPPRAQLGRDRDESAALELADGHGRTRARLRVTKAGEAGLEFLDEAGAVVARYPEPR
jgi:hypothetical protein